MSAISATFPFAWKTSNYNVSFLFHYTRKSFFEVNIKEAHPRSNLLIIKLWIYIFNLLPLLTCQLVGRLIPGDFTVVCVCVFSKIETSPTPDNLQVNAFVKKHHRIRKSKSWMQPQEQLELRYCLCHRVKVHRCCQQSDLLAPWNLAQSFEKLQNSRTRPGEFQLPVPHPAISDPSISEVPKFEWGRVLHYRQQNPL